MNVSLLTFRKNTIKSVLEILGQGLLNDISNIPEEKICSIETNMLKACENYFNVCLGYRYKQEIDKSSKNKHITMIKQGKGKEVVSFGKTKMQRESF